MALGLVGPTTSSRARGRRRRGAARAVAGVAGRADLHADVPKAACHPGARVLFHFREAGAARVVVAVGAVPDLAAEELIERHPGALALDVPERDVHAAHRVEEHRPVAPVRAHVARLPDVLDLVDVAADEERLEVLVDRRLHDERALREGRAPPADEAGLGRLDLHDHEPDAIGRRQDRLDVADLDRCGAPDRLFERRRRARRERAGQSISRRDERCAAGHGHRSECITTVHHCSPCADWDGYPPAA